MMLTKTQTYKILFLIIYWMLSAFYYVFLEGSIVDFAGIFYNVEELSYDYGRILFIVFILVLIGAGAIAVFEILFFNKLLRKKPLGFTLLIKAAFYLISIFLLSSIGTIVNYSFELNKSVFSYEVLSMYFSYLSGLKMWMRLLYWGFAVMSAIFILHVNDKFGRGVLVNFLTGKYHSPREENRVFMFLDLKSSTSYAEKLGHIKYSRLIQDCFFDLTNIAIRYNAQIYQYVGDEVVLTWEVKDGVKNNNCIDSFFAYDEVINSKNSYYKNKYGVVPEFKAGLNAGYVTVAEVGELKKEIAYHGDTLNTAARLRSYCSHANKRLIISAELLSLLDDLDNVYDVESLGVLNLKGKKNIVALFCIEKKNKSVV